MDTGEIRKCKIMRFGKQDGTYHLVWYRYLGIHVKAWEQIQVVHLHLDLLIQSSCSSSSSSSCRRKKNKNRSALAQLRMQIRACWGYHLPVHIIVSSKTRISSTCSRQRLAVRRMSIIIIVIVVVVVIIVIIIIISIIIIVILKSYPSLLVVADIPLPANRRLCCSSSSSDALHTWSPGPCGADLDSSSTCLPARP